MAFQSQIQNSRFPNPIHTPASRPRATNIRSSQPALSMATSSCNVSTGLLPPAKPPSTLIRVDVDVHGNLRFVHAEPNSTSASNTPSPSGSNAPLNPLSQQSPGLPSRVPKGPYNGNFVAFGIPAERTQASRKEICRNFINPATRCSWGNMCIRIHPLDRESYLKKMWGALDVDSPPPTANPPPPQIKSDEQPPIDKDTSQSLLLSIPSEPSPTIPPSPTSRPLDAITGPDGWDPDGSWNPISKAESWTTSPATSNDPLLTASSGSTSPTTATPEASDDDKEETKTTPVTRQPGNDETKSIPVTSQPDKDETKSSPVTRRPLKSAICIMFQRKGTCFNGDRCMFKHVRNAPEQQVPLNQATSSSKPPANETISAPPSIALTQTTASVTSVTSHAKSVPQPRSRRPRPKTNLTCHRWLKDRCQFGYACRFIHNDLIYDDDPVDQTSPVADQSSSVSPEQLGAMDEFLLSFTLRDHMRIQCSAGFDIQRIQTAFESSTLLVSNISSRVRPNHLRETLSSYGTVEDLRMPSIISTGSVVKVTYSDAAEAQKAQSALNGTKMYNLTITARVANSGNTITATNAILKDTSIRISWEAPAKEVFAGYSTREQAEKALQISQTTPLNGHYLQGQIYEGMPAVDNVNIHFYGVPVDVDKADLVRFVNPVDVMWTRPNYTDAEAAVKFVRGHLRSFGPESIDILPPPYRDGGMVKAWATFPSASKAKEAAHSLDGLTPKATGFTPIQAAHVQSLSYSLIPEKWSKIGPGIDRLQASLRGNLVTLSVTRRDNGHRFVRLSGNDQRELAHLKNQLEGILKGEVVRCDGKTVYDSYFTRREGEQFLEDLAIKNPEVHFVNDVQRQRIYVYGYSVDRAHFMNPIITKVKMFRSQQQLEIPLPGCLLGAILKDKALSDLRHKHGLDNCYIDVPRRSLRVRGDFGLYQKFQSAVNEIAARLPKQTTYTGPTCPICFDKPLSPIRLQCGHAWCHDCISHYFRSATEQKTFPVKCLGNEGRCGVKIPIGVAKGTLTGDELESIVEAAFLAHIYARPKDFHFCPSPNCPQVYRSTQQKATLQCPSCLTSICTRCHSQEHDELQCPDQVQDELFRKWIKENDVKHCPTCAAPIEKIEGCNHMTCTRCQTHICWQCMKTFPGGEGIYGHMREVHGTFGLGHVFN